MGRRRPGAEIRPLDGRWSSAVERLHARDTADFDVRPLEHDRANHPDLCRLAFVEDTLVGAIHARRLGNDHPDRRGWCRIDALTVDPAWRRQGIGTRLVRAVLTRATGSAAPGATATCPEDSGAEGFWIALGFVPAALELSFERNHRPERTLRETLGVERTRLQGDRAVATIPLRPGAPDRRPEIGAACNPMSVHTVYERPATSSERRAALAGARRLGGGSGPLRRCGICGRWHAWGLGGPEPAETRLCRACLDAWRTRQQQQQQQ